VRMIRAAMTSSTRRMGMEAPGFEGMPELCGSR
jgi:hypothetical protein